MFKNVSIGYVMFGIVGVILLIGISLVVLPKTGVFANKSKIDLKSFSRDEQVKHLDKTYKTYKNMQSEEHQVSWLDLYRKAQYRNGGNSTFGYYDCLNAVFHYWWSKGAQMVIKTINEVERELRNLIAIDRAKKRDKFVEVELGDILIFEPNDKAISWHIAVVTRVVNGKIGFSDMNPDTNMGLERFFVFGQPFYGHNVRVYGMAWDYWIGNTLMGGQ